MVKRLESSQIEEKAVSLVEDILNEANWVSNRLYRDFGIDLHVKVFESLRSRKAMPWEFHIQVKGRKALYISNNQISFSIDTEHLKDWYESQLPVLFVICDVKRKKLYWLWIKEYIEEELKSEWREQKSITLNIPTKNRIAPSVLPDLLSDLKRPVLFREGKEVLKKCILLAEGYDPNAKVFEFFEYEKIQKKIGDELKLLEDSLDYIDIPIRDPAIAYCMRCGSYFWFDQKIAHKKEEYFIIRDQERSDQPTVYEYFPPNRKSCAHSAPY